MERKAPGVGGTAGAPGRRRGRGAAVARPVQAAGRRGDDRLGDALTRLGVTHLDEASVAATLGVVLKYREDQARLREHGLAATVGPPAPAVPEAAPSFDAATRRSRLRPGAARRRPARPDRQHRHVRRGARRAVGWGSGDEVYWAARATLCTRPEDVERFDACFRGARVARRSRVRRRAARRRSRRWSRSTRRVATVHSDDDIDRGRGRDADPHRAVQPGGDAAPSRLRHVHRGRTRRSPTRARRSPFTAARRRSRRLARGAEPPPPRRAAHDPRPRSGPRANRSGGGGARRPTAIAAWWSCAT